MGALSQSYERIGKPKRVLLGFSGGMDSLVLFYALRMLQNWETFSLVCGHINHGLRKTSDQEQQWAEALMREQGIPLLARRVSVSKIGNLEDNARTARYRALESMRAETESDVVALSHHADDQAETILMHLMRGAGLTGIAGMRELSGRLWRPFLCLPKKILKEFAQESGFTWLEDESNRDLRFTRNRIRENLLPEMESISTGFAARMAKNAVLLQDEDAAWKMMEDRWLDKYAKLHPPFTFLLTEPFLHESIALRRRLMRKLALSRGIQLDMAQTEVLLDLANQPAGSVFNLPRGEIAYRSAARLHLILKGDSETQAAWPALNEIKNTSILGDGKRIQSFDADLQNGAILRKAQPQDRITPLGMTGTQSLLKYLSARRVDTPFRPFWPVLAKGHQVLWAIGLGMAQTAAVTENTLRRVTFAFGGLLPDEIDLKGETAC